MASIETAVLPPFAPFPETTWRAHLVPDEWIACLDAWVLLSQAHLSLDASGFQKRSAKDESLAAFLVSYTRELALSAALAFSQDVHKSRDLRRNCFLLSGRMLSLKPAPESLVHCDFLADLSKAYGKANVSKILARVWQASTLALEQSLSAEKVSLISQLEVGLKGKPDILQDKLKRLNHLLYASPETAQFFMSGSDFLDGLISCYIIMNPPLRKSLISTTYLCLIGLTEGFRPNVSLLTDQLYSLKAAAEAHRSGPRDVNDSLVAELVTVTPICKQLKERVERIGNGSSRTKAVLVSLETFRKAGDGRTKRIANKTAENGKGVARGTEDEDFGKIHVHRMSLVTQVQDLFSDLGSGFIVKLLDEYNDDVEQVISHLLEGTLPSHLANLDRSEALPPTHQSLDRIPDIEPRSTPPLLPTRHNVFDDDEFDQLAVDTSRLHFGHRHADLTADSILKDRSTAPDKAAILSALAAFDSDDDERDDTYDIEDVGGTVDSATPGNNPEEADGDARDSQEEALFRAFKVSPQVYERDAATRRGAPRAALKQETGLTDEALEGWAVMLSRDPRHMRRLEAKFSNFSGGQRELVSTAWRADSGTEDSDFDARGGMRGRGGRGRGRGRGGAGNVAGFSGDKGTEAARRGKEANKGSRANHNRRDQRAKKMARGGFPG